MKTNIFLAALACLVLAGCPNPAGDDQDGKKGKTDAELRAERNKPIYAQFIGEWDNYDDEALTIKGQKKLSPTSSKFFSDIDKDIDYSDLIYTLKEFKEVIGEHPRNIPEAYIDDWEEFKNLTEFKDLTKDGFIKLKVSNEVREVYENGKDGKLIETDDISYSFFRYHFYDKDTLYFDNIASYLYDIDWPSSYGYEKYRLIYWSKSAVRGFWYKRVQSGGGGSGETVSLPGSYELTAGGYTCTLTFNSNGTYTFDHPVGTDRDGTWTQSGGELTMSCTVPGTGAVTDVFITTEEGNVVTLTLKDTSAGVSNILANFNIAATSVSLTRK